VCVCVWDLTESQVKERDLLTESLRLIHDILTDVNQHVAATQKQQRLSDICRRLDAKAFTTFHGDKFKVRVVSYDERNKVTL